MSGPTRFPAGPAPTIVDGVPVRDLGRFSTAGYERGRPAAVQAAWFALQHLVFRKWWCPARLRVALLRRFGATVGRGVLIRHGVRVHWPWKLSIGDNSWIGEGAWLLNLEPIDIGPDVCVSQEALVCTGGHDHRTMNFAFRNRPVRLEHGCWVAARAVVLPGVTVGPGAVVAANTTASRDVPAGQVLLPGSGRPRVGRARRER